MKILFIGSVEYSARTLEFLIKCKSNIVGICTLQSSKINSDHVDLSVIAKKFRIPVKYTPDINSKESIEWISKFNPDIIFCFGWSYLIRSELLNIPSLGVLGFHPSPLPRNRGRHPIVWSLALGLKKTASTFFFMDKYADSGEILSQALIDISKDDNASTLYEKIIDLSLMQLKDFLPLLESGQYSTKPQDQSLSNTWRKRDLFDGQIDWRMSAESIYNLVRALSKPYVGAHFIFKDTNIKVWESSVLKGFSENIEPGKVVDIGRNGPVIKAGEYALELLDLEPKIELKKGDYL